MLHFHKDPHITQERIYATPFPSTASGAGHKRAPEWVVRGHELVQRSCRFKLAGIGPLVQKQSMAVEAPVHDNVDQYRYHCKSLIGNYSVLILLITITTGKSSKNSHRSLTLIVLQLCCK